MKRKGWGMRWGGCGMRRISRNRGAYIPGMTDREPSNWPTPGYIGAVVFGWSSCQCLGARLSFIWNEVQYEILAVQSSIAALFLARLVVARVRKERNDAWKWYAVFSLTGVLWWEMLYGIAEAIMVPM